MMFRRNRNRRRATDLAPRFSLAWRNRLAAAATGAGIAGCWSRWRDAAGARARRPISPGRSRRPFQRVVAAADREAVAPFRGAVSPRSISTRCAPRSKASPGSIARACSAAGRTRVRVSSPSRWRPRAGANGLSEHARRAVSAQRALRAAGAAAAHGPAGTEAQVAQLYLDAQGRLLEVGMRLTGVRLDARGAWELAISDGIRVRLGRQAVDERARALHRRLQPDGRASGSRRSPTSTCATRTGSASAGTAVLTSRSLRPRLQRAMARKSDRT